MQKYQVSTYSHACNAYIRTTLRRALEFQGRDNIWSGTEYVNAAHGMVGVLGWSDILPDEPVWELTKLELMTIRRALEWRQGKRTAGSVDTSISSEQLEEWAQIEQEITNVLRTIWHSEGKYWM